MVKTPTPPSASTAFPLKTYLQERIEVINWLKAHNYPTLPVAPLQEPYSPGNHKIISEDTTKEIWSHCPLTASLEPLPLFTGKNPSYLDFSGKPHLVNHRRYQNQLPSAEDEKQWFANPLNGVGTLGGWNNTVWLDFDVKQFASESECTQAVTKIIENPALTNTFLERTHSGGWRIGIKVKQKPNFTNFALTPGGRHVGEALFEGRFTVLAPTVGTSGNPYQSLSRVQPLEVESLESMGIYSTKIVYPEPPRSSVTPKPISSTPGSIPLEMLGSTNSREILLGACPTGDRSEALATAIQEWYGWHNWTRDNGIAPAGDVETLAHYAGGQLGIDSDRINRILKTIDPTSCHPAAFHRGGDESCWKKIHRLDKATFVALCPTHIKDSIKREWGAGSGEPGVGSRRQVRGSSPTSFELSLRDGLLNILGREPSQSQQKEDLIKLAHQTGHSLRTIEQLAEVISSEIEFGIDTAAAAQNLSNLLSTRKTHLKLERYLEPGFAKLLIETATAMPTAPEFLFTTLLPAAASRIGTAARVIIKSSGQYTQPMVIWSALVADSGAMKTPAQRVIIDPLIARETAAAEAYELQLEEYKNETERRKVKKREVESESAVPIKPVRKRYITKDITLETLQRIHGENPRGLLYYRDELVGMHKSRNLYRGGVGADEEAELDQHNGSAIIYDRGDKSVCLGSSGISRTGSIQWEVLASLMGDHGDFNGQFARWLFCATKAPKRYLRLTGKDADIDTGLTQALDKLYANLEKLAPRDYLLSFDAKQLFELWQNKLVDAQGDEPEGSGISLVYPKIEGYTARLALWLHIVNSTLRGEAPTQVITAQTMELAIELAAYFLWQHKLIHAHNSPDAGAMPLLIKIHSFASRVGQVTASSLKSGVRALKKMATAQIRQLMQAAAQSGIGRIEGEGSQLIYIPESILRSVNFDPKLAQVSTAPIQVDTGLETEIDVLDTSANLKGNDSCESPRQFVNELPPTLVSDPVEPIDTDHQFSSQLTTDETDDPDPDDTPPDGSGGGVSPTPQPSNPNQDGGAALEMLTTEEVATWVDLMAGCQTLEDASAFDECLSVLPLHHQTKIGEAAPDLITQLWQLPEAAASHDTELLHNVLSEPDTGSRDDAASLVLDLECQNPRLNPTLDDETSLAADVADAQSPELAVANSIAIKELVQLTIDGKAELIEQILPQAKQLDVALVSSEKTPLHDFQPGMRVISLSTQRKGVVSRLFELNLIGVRFEDNPQFECPCSYKFLKRLKRLS